MFSVLGKSEHISLIAVLTYTIGQDSLTPADDSSAFMLEGIKMFTDSISIAPILTQLLSYPRFLQDDGNIEEALAIFRSLGYIT
jgi:hypothetical protein